MKIIEITKPEGRRILLCDDCVECGYTIRQLISAWAMNPFAITCIDLGWHRA